MIDFNDTKDTYQEAVQRSIGFAGQDHDFFIAVKAEILEQVVKRDVAAPRPRILDVGCGHGLIHPRLSGMGFDVVGVDVATEVLAMAREANPGIAYHAYDGTRLPFESASFDVATAFTVMHHVPPAQWPAFLAEMRRVLKPGGIVVVFEHNPYNPLTRYVVATSPLDEGVVLLSNGRLKKLMAEVGLRAESRYIFFTPFANRFFRWLDGKLGFLPIGAQYYVTATSEVAP